MRRHRISFRTLEKTSLHLPTRLLGMVNRPIRKDWNMMFLSAHKERRMFLSVFIYDSLTRWGFMLEIARRWRG